MTSEKDTYPVDGIAVLFVCRHGETELNAAQKFRGAANPPLNQNGMRDAHHLAALFEPYGIGFIVSSDKLRATTTADLIAQRHDLKAHRSQNLRSFNVGTFSGQPRDPETMERFKHYIDNPSVQIPEGESLNQFKDRIRPCLKEAIEHADAAGKPGLLVAHSSIVHEVGDLLYNDHSTLLVEPGGAIVVYVKNGSLHATAIHKPLRTPPPANLAESIS